MRLTSKASGLAWTFPPPASSLCTLSPPSHLCGVAYVTAFTLLFFFLYSVCLQLRPSQTVLSSVSLASVRHNIAERRCVSARPRSEWSIKADPSKITADRPSVFHHVRFQAAVCLYFVCVCVRVRASGGAVCVGLFLVWGWVCVKTQSKQNRRCLKY